MVILLTLKFFMAANEKFSLVFVVMATACITLCAADAAFPCMCMPEQSMCVCEWQRKYITFWNSVEWGRWFGWIFDDGCCLSAVWVE